MRRSDNWASAGVGRAEKVKIAVFSIYGRILGGAGCGGIGIAEARFPKHLTKY